MKGYGMKGEMNPQKNQKKDMTPSNHFKGKMGGQKEPGAAQGSRDMSPKVKVANEQAVWQNQR
jgi:hypothetical protein